MITHLNKNNLTAGAIILLLIVFVFSFYTNLHASSGMPYFDDWEYYFAHSQGLQTPLTLRGLFAKEADYVAPLVRVFGRIVWQASGADLLVFRFLTWVLFGLTLAIYLRLLLRLAPEWGWLAAAVSLVLLSTANVEYFYFQHVAIFQPLFFLILIGSLTLAFKDNLTAEALLLFLAGSFGIFGAGYALGTVGYALALGIVRWRRHGIATFLNPRILVIISVGLVVAIAIGYLTFADSYINHTHQALITPWHTDFWFFLFSSFASALGFAHDMPSRYFLVLGFLAFILYAGPIFLFLSRSSGEPSPADFVLGSFLAGTILVAMITAAGRGLLCGAELADIKTCGATPRYVFPIVLALPAAVVALARAIPGKALRSMAVAVALTLIGAGYLIDRNFHFSLMRWDFAPSAQKMVERDSAARVCITKYLEASRSSQIGQTPDWDWQWPLICDTTLAVNNLTPFLQTAHQIGAPFLTPILADLNRRPQQPSLKMLLSSATITADGPLPAGLLRATNEVTGHIDRIYDLKEETQAAVGWAADLEQHEPVSYVLAVMDGRVVAVGFTGTERPDVATALGNAGLKNSGFAIALGTRAGDGKTVRLLAVTQSNKLAELKGDILDPEESAALIHGDAATLSDAHCYLDRINQSAPTGQPLSVGRAISVQGWTIISGRDGIAPDSMVLSLRSETGQETLIRTHKEARPDVKAHFGHSAMADPGFGANADLGRLAGTYQLDILQVHAGQAYSCGLQQPIVVR